MRLFAVATHKFKENSQSGLVCSKQIVMFLIQTQFFVLVLLFAIEGIPRNRFKGIIYYSVKLSLFENYELIVNNYVKYKRKQIIISYNMVCSEFNQITSKRSHGLKHPGRSWFFLIIHEIIDHMSKLGDNHFVKTQQRKERNGIYLM